jgi:hypothetical protein
MGTGMWRDPIVEEVRRLREEYAAQFNHDLKAVCGDLRERQKESGRKIVSLAPKRAPRINLAANRRKTRWQATKLDSLDTMIPRGMPRLPGFGPCQLWASGRFGRC